MRMLLLVGVLLSGCSMSVYRKDRQRFLSQMKDASITAFEQTGGTGRSASKADENPLTEGPITIEQVVGYAMHTNPEITAAMFHWEKLLQRTPQALSLEDPHIVFEKYLRPTQTRSGPKEFKIQASQTLPWPGKRALDGEIAIEAARMAESDYRNRILAVVLAVEEAYADFELAHRLIEINERLKKISTSLEHLAREKLESGKANQRDVLRAQIQIVHFEHRSLVLEGNRRVARETLNAILSRPAEAKMGIPVTRIVPGLESSLTNLVDRAWKGSPSLATAEHAVSMALAGHARSRLTAMPDFVLGLRYESVGGGSNPVFDKDGEDILAISAGINIPLRLKANAASVAEANAGVRQARAHYYKLKMEIQRQVAVAHARYVELAQEAYLLKNTLLVQARQHLTAARRAYASGELDLLTLLDSQKNIEEIQNTRATVMSRQFKVLARLKEVIGDEPE